LPTGRQKLAQDLIIVEAMASEMVDYLKSEVLFWQMMKGGLPKLTLGGYLMRQHRLLALPSLLDEAQQTRLDAAVRQFNLALVEKIVRLEEKAHRELEARIRQWSEFLNDLQNERGVGPASYPSAVDTRAMMAAIIDKLQMAPYQLEPRLLSQVALLDANLNRRWQKGEFIWPDAWQPAYPAAEYWWLYGRPKQRRRK
jgi:hypothetical protein